MSQDSIGNHPTDPGRASGRRDPSAPSRPMPDALGLDAHSLGDEVTRAGAGDSQAVFPEEQVGGRYAILELIGKGGMGAVYRCRDTRLGRAVAVKRLRGDREQGPLALERFRREADAIAQLAHPNIVALLDTGEDHAGPFLVMELLQGCDLHRWVVDHGPLAADAVVEVGKQVCRALSYAHGHGLVHRDIKPSNLQRLPDGTVKLLDFGIVRGQAHATVTQVRAAIGSFEFAAPEQKQDASHADARSDLYALGATLYYLLHGHVSLHEGYGPQVPRALQELVTRLLKRAPEERPASADDVLARLMAIHSPKSDAPRAAVVAAGASVSCVHCAAPNLPGSRYCVNCGAEVHERCYKCNEQDLQRRRYCAHCRADLEARRRYEVEARAATACAAARKWQEAAEHWAQARTHCPEEPVAVGESERCASILREVHDRWADALAAEEGLDLDALDRAVERLVELLPPEDLRLRELLATTRPAVAEQSRTRADAHAQHVARAKAAEAARDWA
ncbi:MAG: serine/threonine-protein kinase, partial [Planctomycetia bacterium]